MKRLSPIALLSLLQLTVSVLAVSAEEIESVLIRHFPTVSEGPEFEHSSQVTNLSLFNDVTVRAQNSASDWISSHSCTDMNCTSTCESAFGGEEPCCGNLRLSEFNIYPTFSYAGDDAATYNEFEFASHMDLGPFAVENRTVMNVADLPSSIVLGPTNPTADPLAGGTGGSSIPTRSNGFGDILSGTFFSLRDHEANYELGIGPVLTFPTASSSGLGSEVYTAGPGVHFSTEIETLTLGFFLWQSWSFGGPNRAKVVNQLFGKPFLIYELTEEWQLVYIPLGMSHSWKKPSGQRTTIPIGGGLRRLFDLGDHKLGLQAQAFSYVSRKKADPEWELRFTIEFLFDES